MPEPDSCSLSIFMAFHDFRGSRDFIGLRLHKSGGTGYNDRAYSGSRMIRGLSRTVLPEKKKADR